MDQRQEARLLVYEQLQRHQRILPPGSKRYEIVEHALDLALNDGHRAHRFLLRNLVRDSRRILERQAGKRPTIIIDEIATWTQTPSPLVDNANPETLLLQKQQLDLIRQDIAPHSSYAVRVLEGLILGESLRETAEACGMSTSRVNQLRRYIRQAGLALCEQERHLPRRNPQ